MMGGGGGRKVKKNKKLSGLLLELSDLLNNRSKAKFFAATSSALAAGHCSAPLAPVLLVDPTRRVLLITSLRRASLDLLVDLTTHRHT
jgi:hypothetical protein